MHAVHGNEISSSEAALLEAYHLLAAQGDAAVDADPARVDRADRSAAESRTGAPGSSATTAQGRAAAPDAEPLSAEHDEPWPGGRANHYLFDMNRDWFAQSQPETRGRTRLFLEWFPHVVVDLHEMGGDSTYYFAPPADPLNPHITKAQAELVHRVRRQNARAFDARGFAYFIREVFDSFYPGYGESWPMFHGRGRHDLRAGVVARPRLPARRRDAATYRDGVMQHFTAALTTLETAARNREKILRDFLEYRRSASRRGRHGPRARVPAAAGRRSRARRSGSRACSCARASKCAVPTNRHGSAPRTLPAGTYVVSDARSPPAGCVRNLLEPHCRSPRRSSKSRNGAASKRLGDQIYDIDRLEPARSPSTSRSCRRRPPSRRRPSAVHGDMAAPAAAAAAGEGRVPAALGRARPRPPSIEPCRRASRCAPPTCGFTLGGRTYPAGTAIVRVVGQRRRPARRARRDRRAARCRGGRHRQRVHRSGHARSGATRSSTLKRRVCCWRGMRPTSSQSAGWARYVLERRFGQPVSAVRVASLARVDLRRLRRRRAAVRATTADRRRDDCGG